MLTILFFLLMISIFGKLAIFALKAAWGITRIIVTIIFLPFTLIALFFAGAVYIALPILLIVGLFALFAKRV